MARQSKLTLEVKTKIINVLKGGGTECAAFTSAGVGESTFYRWMQLRKGASRGRYREFWEEVRRAQQDAVIRNVMIIQKAAMGGEVLEKTTVTKPDGTTIVREKKAPPAWQAATWWLERRHPDDWGRRDRIDHRTPDGPLVTQNDFIFIEDRIGRAIREPRPINAEASESAEQPCPIKTSDMLDLFLDKAFGPSIPKMSACLAMLINGTRSNPPSVPKS